LELGLPSIVSSRCSFSIGLRGCHWEECRDDVGTQIAGGMKNRVGGEWDQCNCIRSCTHVRNSFSIHTLLGKPPNKCLTSNGLVAIPIEREHKILKVLIEHKLLEVLSIGLWHLQRDWHDDR
jgi:hypothetical protein